MKGTRFHSIDKSLQNCPPKLAGLSVERPAHYMQGALPFFSCVTRDRKSSKIRWCLFLYLKISAIFAPTSNKKHVDKSFFELRKKTQLFLWKDQGFFESNICNSQKVEKDEKWKMSNQTAKVRIGHQWYVMFNQPQCPWNFSRNSLPEQPLEEYKSRCFNFQPTFMVLGLTRDLGSTKITIFESPIWHNMQAPCPRFWSMIGWAPTWIRG